MRAYSQRSLTSLSGIHSDLRRVIDRALQDSPLDFAVIEGLRTKKRQEQLVASGASQTMNSRHLTGHAVDLLPIDPATGRGEFAWPLYDQLGPAVKAAAKKEGVPIIWGTVQTSVVQGVSAAGGAIAALQSLDGTAQIIVLVGCFAFGAMAMFILRERLRAWASGWR